MSNKKQRNYQNGKIYKIVNDVNDMIYVGSTVSQLRLRMESHKECAKTRTSRFYAAMNEIGKPHFKIVLVQPFPCTSKDELNAKECEVMNSFPRETLYNTMFDGKHAQETKDQMMEFRKGRALKRGCIGTFLSCRGGSKSWGWSFQWSDGQKKNNKRFAVCPKRTSPQAYMACIDLQNEIYPLTTEDYLDELPFCN
jgi:hypothetical protein